MDITAVNLELPINGAAKFVMRNHSADGAFDEQLGVTCATRPSVLGFVPTDETGKAHVTFLLFLLATQTNLLGVNDYDEVARIDVRCIDGLFFSAQEIGGFHGNLTEHLIIGVDDPPFARDFAGFCGKRLHWPEKGTETTGQPQWCQTQLARDPARARSLHSRYQKPAGFFLATA